MALGDDIVFLAIDPMLPVKRPDRAQADARRNDPGTEFMLMWIKADGPALSDGKQRRVSGVPWRPAKSVISATRHLCSEFLGQAMKFKLSVRKAGTKIYENVHDIRDLEGFRGAFGDVWVELQDRRLQETSSIGALMEVLAEDLLEDLDGSEIRLEKV
jgi:hypothetical protein